MYHVLLSFVQQNEKKKNKKIGRFPVMGRNNARPSHFSVISFINYVIH